VCVCVCGFFCVFGSVVYCKVRYSIYNDGYQASEGNIYIIDKDL